MANFIQYNNQPAVNLDLVGVIKLHKRHDYDYHYQDNKDSQGVIGQPSIAFYANEPDLNDIQLVQRWAFGEVTSSWEHMAELGKEAEYIYNYIMHEHLRVTKIPMSDAYKEYVVQLKLSSQ